MAYNNLITVMKKFLFLFVFLFSCSVSFAAYERTIKDSRIKKEECFERIKKWVATTLHSKSAEISYEDFPSGTLVINGYYEDTEPTLMAIRYDFI